MTNAIDVAQADKARLAQQLGDSGVEDRKMQRRYFLIRHLQQMLTDGGNDAGEGEDLGCFTGLTAFSNPLHSGKAGLPKRLPAHWIIGFVVLKQPAIESLCKHALEFAPGILATTQISTELSRNG